MTDVILVLNAGSSSVKFSTFAVDALGRDLALRYRGAIDGIGSDPRFVVADAEGRRVVDQAVAARRVGAADHEGLLPLLHEWIAGHADQLRVVAVGHRVVHGGEQFAAPVMLDDVILDQLEKLAPLAPLHQPHNLAPIRVISRIAPDIPQVACFDTAFHRTQPPVSQLYALPRDLSATGIKRYGFHGLSYEYIASVLPGIVGDAARRPRRDRAPRQRLQHVRHAGRQECRDDDGLHGTGRAADGDTLGCDRSRRRSSICSPSVE